MNTEQKIEELERKGKEMIIIQILKGQQKQINELKEAVADV